MGLFDFLFKKQKKDAPNVAAGDENASVEEVVEPSYPKLVATPDFSRTIEEKHAVFEYIDFKVAGTYYYQKEIKQAIKLEMENGIYFDERYQGMTNKEIIEDTYDEPIFQYDGALFSDAFVILEPENEYDPEAIAVYINDLKVGHVPKKEFEEGKKYIYDLMAGGKNPHLSLSLTGGRYKVNRDDEIATGESAYKLEGQLVIRTEK
ncbi:hypothetical protein GLW20_01825 [Virgibacillus halodenitrificans]|nr:hypothetical protein [Virgibacillus halodenitrificans]